MEIVCNCQFSLFERVGQVGQERLNSIAGFGEVTMGSFRPRNLSDILQILWSRKLLIGFISAVLLLSAFIIINSLPHLDESRALILVSGAIYYRQANVAQ